MSQLLQSGASSTRAVQFKLMIGESGDRYEQEADRVADQVMQGSHEQPVEPIWRRARRISNEHVHPVQAVEGSVHSVRKRRFNGRLSRQRSLHLFSGKVIQDQSRKAEVKSIRPEAALLVHAAYATALMG